MAKKIDLEESKNDDSIRMMISELKRKQEEINLGGGQSKIDKQHAKGKLIARERIDFLLDDKDNCIEIGSFVGEGMYEEYGGCPSGGVVVKIGYVSKRLCIIVANDATVKAGAWFPITAKKNLRAQEISIENRLPIIYLVDSAGVFLPMQDEIFPDKEHFGRMFRNNAIMSSMGISQIAETLGGATTHCEISGVTDYKSKDDKDCLTSIRNIMDKMGESNKAGFSRTEPAKPNTEEKALYSKIPYDRNKQYDVKEVINCLVDNSEFEEYKELHGKTIVCGYARIDGWAVGIQIQQTKLLGSS